MMQPVAGYTDQPDTNVELVNYNKQVEEMLLRMCDGLAGDTGSMTIDQRWLSVARTHFEQGFMALNRSIFQPQRVKITTAINITPDKESAT